MINVLLLLNYILQKLIKYRKFARLIGMY